MLNQIRSCQPFHEWTEGSQIVLQAIQTYEWWAHMRTHPPLMTKQEEAELAFQIRLLDAGQTSNV